MYREHEVNPAAEAISSTVAAGVLIVNLFLALSLIIGGIFSLKDGEIGGLLIAAGVVVGLAGVIMWASLKVIVNISRSLYNINELLFAQGSNDATSQSKPEAIPANTKFSVGQLVISKEDESQFRVATIKIQEGENVYFSEKHDRFFKESEIEDFNSYWAGKSSV